MKHHLRILWSAAAGLIIVLAAPLAPAWTASASSVANLAAREYLITLNVQNMPLGAVLEKIEADTDLKFNIDEQWKDVPVSVTLEKTPLDRALQRILVNLNNVVIYGSNDQVKIVVFGKAAPGAASGRPAGPPLHEQPPPPLPDEYRSFPQESEPEDGPAPEESSEAAPADQERKAQDSAAEGEGEPKTDDAESGSQNEPAAEGGAPQEDQPAGQQQE